MGTLLATSLVLLLGAGMFILLLRPTTIYISVDTPAKPEPSGCLGPLLLLLLLLGVCLLWVFGSIQFL